MKFLTNMERQLHWPQKGTAEVVALIEDAFLAATDDDAGQAALLGLTDTSAPTEARALQTAVRYVEEWKVVGWARRQNAMKGLAPSTDLLLHHAEQRRSQLLDAAELPPFGGSTASGGRIWGHRFRQRWGGRQGAFRVREVLSLEEMHAAVDRRTMVGGP